MTLEEKNLPEDFEPDVWVVNAINDRLSDGKLICAAAFAIAHELNVPPLDVGRTADVLGIRLTRCQLGLFGYPQKQGWHTSDVAELPVPPELPDAMEAARDAEGHLTCASAWKLASDFRVPRMQIGYLAEQMGIKIRLCQLGAF